MKMNSFVASCLYMDGAVFDEYCDAFDVDMTEEDVHETLDRCYGCGDYNAFGPEILRCMFEKVIREYRDVLDEGKFDYDFSSPSYPDFYYDGKHINSKADLDEIVEKAYESDTD